MLLLTFLFSGKGVSYAKEKLQEEKLQAIHSQAYLAMASKG